MRVELSLTTKVSTASHHPQPPPHPVSTTDHWRILTILSTYTLETLQNFSISYENNIWLLLTYSTKYIQAATVYIQTKCTHGESPAWLALNDCHPVLANTTQQHTPQIPSKNFFSDVSEAQNSTTWHYLFTGTGRWTSSSSSRMFKIFSLPSAASLRSFFVPCHFQSLVTESWNSKHINVSGMYGHRRCISTCFQFMLFSRISIQNYVWFIFKWL